jgi:glycerate 2-kinase
MRLMQHGLDEPTVRDAVTGGPVSVVAAGKAAEGMVRGLLAMPGVQIVRGVAVGPGRSVSLPAPFVWHAGGHPLPDSGSVRGGLAALQCAEETHAFEPLVVLLSGGASAMLAAPVTGVTLAEKVEATRLLLASGVPIHELNCVRKHLSDLKGGRLAMAAQGPTVTLAISDVVSPVENDPAVIGSGPTAPDGTTYAEALAIARGATGMPRAVLDVLKRGSLGEARETLEPDDARATSSVYRVIGSRRQAMAGASAAAKDRGYAVAELDAPVVGEASVTGPVHIDRLLDRCRGLRQEYGRPACAVSSGETTVTVTGGGRGGRNQEMALAAAFRLQGEAGAVVYASIGTDGVDGPTDAAGALVDVSTLERAGAAGLAGASRYLATNDSYRFFEALGDLVKTGPTGTNVGDLQIVLTDERGSTPS